MKRIDPNEPTRTYQVSLTDTMVRRIKRLCIGPNGEVPFGTMIRKCAMTGADVLEARDDQPNSAA